MTIPAHLRLTIRNSTNPAAPDGVYELHHYPTGGECGEGAYDLADMHHGPAVSVSVSGTAVGFPVHLESRCALYPLAELPRSGHCVAEGDCFDWTLEEAR